MKKVIGNIILLMICFICLSLVSCSGDKEMNKRFGDGRPYIFTEDATGNKYIIRHNVGDSYFISPIELGE